MKVYQVIGSNRGCGSTILFETHDKGHYEIMVKTVKRISKSLGYTKRVETIVNRRHPMNGYGIYHFAPDVQRAIFKEMNYKF
jgi:hypothetical protein